MANVNYLKILKGLPEFSGLGVNFKRLNTGATNVKYLVTVRNKKYLARFLGQEQEKFLGLNRAREIYNIKMANKIGLGSKVIKHYPKFHLLILSYWDGRVLTKKDVRNTNYLKLIVKLLKCLHSGPKFKGSFDVLRSIGDYQKIIKEDGKKLPISNLDITKFKKTSFIIRQRKFKPVPCHIDLMHLNFIINQGKLNLIDWEYSAQSDALFDLAFLSAQSRFNKKDDEFLLKEYFSEIGDKLKKEFLAMKAIFYWREGLWAMVQLGRSNLPFNYLSYAKKNFKWFSGFNFGLMLFCLYVLNLIKT